MSSLTEVTRHGTSTSKTTARSALTINKEFESFDAFIAGVRDEHLALRRVHQDRRRRSPVGTKVNLRFTVIMDDVETIEGVGEVVRVQRRPARHGRRVHALSDYSQP